MKIFYLLFLVFLFMSCAERGNEEKKVMILGATPEQIVELKGEELPIQELIPTEYLPSQFFSGDTEYGGRENSEGISGGYLSVFRSLFGKRTGR